MERDALVLADDSLFVDEITRRYPAEEAGHLTIAHAFAKVRTPNSDHLLFRLAFLSSYRRLAKEYHPDYRESGSEIFRQIQEAYAVLGNPARREAYDKVLTGFKARRRNSDLTADTAPEPLIPESRAADMVEISPVRSFETYSPSFAEIFDWLWANFSNIHHTKSGRVENLTLEVPLNRQQALHGGNATVMVPAQSICPTCRGEGNIAHYECHRCAGEGAISGEVPISVSIPAGLTKDHSVIIPLDRFGIHNLYFTVLFRPRNID